MLTVAVLGPVEVRRDGETITLPSGKTTEVLVRLALDAGRLVSADRLLDDLWSDNAAGTGKNTLQSKVSQLRRALGKPDLVTSGRGGYLLDIEPGCVDALRIGEMATTTTELLRAGKLEASVRESTQALTLFRGEPLVDAGDSEWLYPHRTRLEQLRLGLLEDNLAARIRLGMSNEAVGELEGLVARYPLRETLWYWLIMALYRSGRQAEALAAYAQVRKTLIDELGLEPGQQLRDLESQVLQQSPDLAAGPVPEQPIVGTKSTGNLPRQAAPLIGRESDFAQLHQLVRAPGLVTVVGTPGVGKTRLAIEVARAAEAPGGSWLIRLDAADDQTSITQAVAETLNVTGEQALFQRVAAAGTLLVFDNCEHVIDAAADLINSLLDSAAGLTVLSTSQLPLGLDGETVYPLEPLEVADSIRLFTSRATKIRPGLATDENTANSIAEVCRSLDGLPLAIELAAARVKSLSVQEISRRLDNRFALLQDPTSRRPERRRALGAAIGWSYDLLFPDDQRGLWALSCFAGGAPLNAVEHVLTALGVPQVAAVDVVSRLVDRSLVHVDIAESGTIRYRLLDSIRAFAADRLRDSPFLVDAGAAHAGWYAENADRCASVVRGPAQPQCVEFVRAERANIDAALAWSAEHQPQLGVRIANGYGWTWVVLGDGVAGAGRVRAALAAAADLVGKADEVAALLLAGWLEASAGNLDRADSDLRQAAVDAEELGDTGLVADVQRHQAFLGLQQGRPDRVLTLTEQSVMTDRSMNRRWEQAAGLLLSASASMMLGQIANSAAAAQTALSLLQPIGDSWGLVHGEAMLGAIAQADHRFADAASHLERAATSSQELGFLGQAAYHLTRLGRVQQQAGDRDLAAVTLYRAIEAARTDGDLRMAATANVNLARVLRATDHTEEAVALLTRTDEWYRQSGGGDGALLTRVLLASMTCPDPTTAATERLEQLREEAVQAHSPEVEVLALDALARIAAQRDSFDRAGQLLELADVRSCEHSTAVDDMDRIDAMLARALLAAH